MLHLIKLFLLEELRLRRSFSSALSLVIFPQLIFLGALSARLFHPLIEGSVSADDLRTGAVGALFMFGISMGGLAFMGREFIERALGPVTMLSASTQYQPVSDRRMYAAYFLHDAIFYLLLVLAPLLGGLLLGCLVRPADPMEALVLAFALCSSFFLGLSLSMTVSAAINNRRRTHLLLVPLSIVPLIVIQQTTDRLEGFLPPMLALRSSPLIWLSVSTILTVVYCTVGIIVFDGMPMEGQRPVSGSYTRIHMAARMVYPHDPIGRSLLARDMVNLIRGKAYVRIAFSMLFPVIIISLMVGMIGSFDGSGLRFNTAFFAVMVSFFTISIYSHLVSMDFLEFDQTIPVDAVSLIRVKLREHILIALPISLLFLLIMTAATGEWKELFFSVPLLLVAIPYMAHVTAYLTGLWTNTLLLDSSVFVRYMVFTVLPLMFSMMLSLLMTSAFLPSVIGMTVIMVMGAFATVIISRKIPSRWKGTVLDSAGGGSPG